VITNSRQGNDRTALRRHLRLVPTRVDKPIFKAEDANVPSRASMTFVEEVGDIEFFKA
jgi:hypothetical protein